MFFIRILVLAEALFLSNNMDAQVWEVVDLSPLLEPVFNTTVGEGRVGDALFIYPTERREQDVEIHVSRFISGSYVLRVQAEEVQWHRKIMIVREGLGKKEKRAGRSPQRDRPASQVRTGGGT